MKNREKLLNTSSYDLLLKAQKELDRHGMCVLMLFQQPDVYERCSGLCELCIERWLNEEAKEGGSKCPM